MLYLFLKPRSWREKVIFSLLIFADIVCVVGFFGILLSESTLFWARLMLWSGVCMLAGRTLLAYERDMRQMLPIVALATIIAAGCLYFF